MLIDKMFYIKMEEKKQYNLLIEGKRTAPVTYIFRSGRKIPIEEYYRETTGEGMRSIKGYIETTTNEEVVVERAIFPNKDVTPTEIELTTSPNYQAELTKVNSRLQSTEEVLETQRKRIRDLERQLAPK